MQALLAGLQLCCLADVLPDAAEVLLESGIWRWTWISMKSVLASLHYSTHLEIYQRLRSFTSVHGVRALYPSIILVAWYNI